MRVRDEIREHARWERESVKLAKQCADVHDYLGAVRWYNAAHVHRGIHQALDRREVLRGGKKQAKKSG